MTRGSYWNVVNPSPKNSLEEILAIEKLNLPSERKCKKCGGPVEVGWRQEHREFYGGKKKMFCSFRCSNGANSMDWAKKNKATLIRSHVVTLLREENRKLYDELMRKSKKEVFKNFNKSE